MIGSPRSHHRPASTLTEVMVVIAVICVLAALSFYFLTMGSRSAANLERMADGAKAKVDSSQANTKKKAGPPAATPAKGTPRPAGPCLPVDGSDRDCVPGEYIVTFTPSVRDIPAEANRLAIQYGGNVLTVFTTIHPAAALRIPDANLANLRTDGALSSIARNVRIRALQQTTPTGVRRMLSFPAIPANRFVLHNPPALQLPRGSNTLIRRNLGTGMNPVAIVDTGIDGSHPDLNVVVSLGFGGIPDGNDQAGHGTHVAGIIGARNNGLGVVGVYPGAPLWSLRVLDASGTGTLLAFLQALQYVFDHAGTVNVCNMSLGTPSVVPVLNSFVDACAIRGVVMVVAAGNSSVLASTWSPASASRAICVAAMGDSDGVPGGFGPKTTDGLDDTFASFSNFGPTISVIAPGVDILSTLPNNSYGMLSGTSMACPHVAGVCALLLDPNTAFPTARNLNLGVITRPTSTTLNATYLRRLATELIPPGIKGDTLSYPMVNFRVQ